MRNWSMGFSCVVLILQLCPHPLSILCYSVLVLHYLKRKCSKTFSAWNQRNNQVCVTFWQAHVMLQLFADIKEPPIQRKTIRRAARGVPWIPLGGRLTGVGGWGSHPRRFLQRARSALHLCAHCRLPRGLTGNPQLRGSGEAADWSRCSALTVGCFTHLYIPVKASFLLSNDVARLFQRHCSEI